MGCSQIDEGTVCIDDDLDGYSEIAGDCDDENPFTYPFAQELPDIRLPLNVLLRRIRGAREFYEISHA